MNCDRWLVVRFWRAARNWLAAAWRLLHWPGEILTLRRDLMRAREHCSTLARVKLLWLQERERLIGDEQLARVAETQWRLRYEELLDRSRASGLSAAQDERLARLVEALGEGAQVAGLVLRLGWGTAGPRNGPALRVVLERKLGNVGAALRLLTAAGDVRGVEIASYRERRIAELGQAGAGSTGVGTRG